MARSSAARLVLHLKQPIAQLRADISQEYGRIWHCSGSRWSSHGGMLGMTELPQLQSTGVDNFRFCLSGERRGGCGGSRGVVREVYWCRGAASLHTAGVHVREEDKMVDAGHRSRGHLGPQERGENAERIPKGTAFESDEYTSSKALP